jgi:Ca2+-transporting ATPase
MSLPPHAQATAAVVEALGSGRGGLDPDEVRRRQERFGPNRLERGRRRSAGSIFLDQFRSFLIGILLLAAGIAAVLGEVIDLVAIALILVLNAVLGFVQEWRAERAMEALSEMAAPQALVMRAGSRQVVPAAELVPGEVCLLEAGSVVPADLRLVEAASLRIDEAPLTGESVPVEKQAEAVHAPDTPLGNRSNMAYASTQVTHGCGVGVATAIGMATELGRIAGLLQSTEAVRTPLQRRLDEFGWRIGILALGICALIFGLGLLRGEPLLQLLLVAVSLAVAAVPEALPAVVTIALALGARRMAARNALVRRLAAVETLGSVTVIGSDKTGTLTQNSMTAEAVEAQGQEARMELLRAAALCNDARLDGEPKGDPTEIALLELAERSGLRRSELLAQSPKLLELPFDSERKRMTTVHAAGSGAVAWVKGAPEALLALSVSVLGQHGTQPLDEPLRRAIREREEALAEQGLRVLGFARRELETPPSSPEPDQLESELTFLGLVGLLDPPRPDAAQAVAECHTAGIRPILITGDHPLTARAIARRLGIAGQAEEPVTGRQLERLDETQLRRALRETSLFARVAPEHKLRIVKALQASGELVAMTGDGVNDAPALKRAEIGVAMGLTGTDVAKEASAMVLLDDRFSTIVGAVREGRRIYDNIRRFVRYILATNLAEIAVMLVAPLLGYPVPLLPLQILWINLVTDGLPGIALALEPAERNTMQRPPRPPGESIFARGLGFHVVFFGSMLAAISILSLVLVWRQGVGQAHARTMVLTVMTLGQMGHCLAIRSEFDSLWRRGPLTNLPLLGAVLLTVALQMAVVYVPPAQAVMRTQGLSAGELGLCLGLALTIFLGVEIEKSIRRRFAA